MNDYDQLTEEFRKSAGTFSITPSSKVWKGVEKELLQRSRKKRIVLFLAISIAVLFLAALIAGISMKRNSPSSLSALAADSSAFHASPNEKIRKEIFNNDYKNKSITENSKTKNNLKPFQNNVEKLNKPNQVSKTLTINNSPVTPSDRFADSLSLRSNASIGIRSSAINAEEPNYLIKDKSDEKSSVQTMSPVDTSRNKIDTDTLVSDMTQNEGRKSKLNKWAISLSIGGAKSFTDILEKGDYSFIENYRDSSDKEPLVMNYHLNFSYDIIPGITIYAGLGINQYKQSILTRQMVYRYDTIPSTFPFQDPVVTVKKDYFFIEGDSVSRINNKLTYLSVPIGIRYNFFPKRKFNMALQADISLYKIIYTKGFTYDKDRLIYTNEIKQYLRSWMISYSFGLVFRYEVMKNLGIELLPVYNIYPQSVYKSSYVISQKFHQLQINISAKYSF